MMKFLIYKENKSWWEKNVLPFLPDNEIMWEDLTLYERLWRIPRLRAKIGG